MRTLLTLSISIFILAMQPALADNHYDLSVKANGIVCDFCAQALNKVFLKNENVKEIDVDMDTSTIYVYLKEGGTITDEEIQKMIEWGGYDFVSLERKKS